MTYKYEFKINNIQTGNRWDGLFKPRKIRGASKYPVIICHGAAASGTVLATSPWTDAFPSIHKLAVALANQGIPVVGGYMGGDTFAADSIAGTSASNFINAALTYVSAATGCSSAKANVIGLSMGAGNTLRWGSLNPSKAASLTGFIPMTSILHIYTDNPNNVAGANSYTQAIATSWALTTRHVTDAVINGTTTMTSATAAFTGADVGRQVVRGFSQTGIQVNTKIASVTNSTTVVLDKVAGTGTAQSITIADPFPMSGTAGGDLLGVHAPRILSAGTPTRLYYSSDDTYAYPADTIAFGTASGATVYNMGAMGHTNANPAASETNNVGTDHSDLIAWLKANGS